MTLSANPAKIREWQQRSAQRARQRAQDRQGGRETRKQGKPRQRPAEAHDGDSAWRAAVLLVYGGHCVVPGCDENRVEADHVWPRAQGGPSDWRNGIPLCGSWSRTVAGGHHYMKTCGRLQFNRSWFHPDALAWFAVVGWVDWDEAGQPFGRGWKHFAPVTVTGRQEGAPHGTT